MAGTYYIVGRFELNNKTEEEDKEEIKKWLRGLAGMRNPLFQFDIYRPDPNKGEL